MTAPRYRCSVLAVDDEPAILALLEGQLGREFDLRVASTAERAKELLTASGGVDMIITDLTLPDATGVQLLDWACRTYPRTARILISGTAKLKDVADAVNCCHVHRIVLKPWRGEDLVAHLRDVGRGVLLERSHEKLLEDLRTLNAELEERVAERTRELQERSQILEKMALTDPLTGLPNRRAIELIARKELLRRARSPGPIAFGLIDADHFKNINSRYLLSGGDQVLTALARTLQRTIRATTDAVGRVGGEEFMVVAPNTDCGGAAALAERLREAVEECEILFHGTPIRVTVSVGFAVADADEPVNYDDLREAAAAALAEAKGTGRNRCVVRPVGELISV
jgi:diguanylate cyclase (GGDEF)-like protein